MQGPQNSLSLDGECLPYRQMLRYGRHARLLELNLSKMLLRLPKAPFFGTKEPDPYEGMIVISSPMKSKMFTASTDARSTNQSLHKPRPYSKNPTTPTAEPEIISSQDHQQPELAHGASEAVVTTKEICLRKKYPAYSKEKKSFHALPPANPEAHLHQKERKLKVNQTQMGQKIALPDLKQDRRKGPLLHRDANELKHIRSQSYAVLQFPTERLILQHRASIGLEIASLTKIMTFYLIYKIAINNSIDLRVQTIVISDHIAYTSGTSADIEEGERYTVEDLLYGLMLPSGNDAALSLAIWGGSFFTEDSNEKARIKAFVTQMNICAKDLGLLLTKFTNPHGLPDSQAKSTALEVARLSCVCMTNQLFKKIVSTKIYKVTVKNELLKKDRVVQWENTNKLLRRPGFIGLKTGITVTAGPCLASAFEFRNKIYVTVILRAPKISGRFKETRRLLHWILNKIYGEDTSEHEKKNIKSLKRKCEHDSDNSEDEHEFKYNQLGIHEYKKRCNILEYEL